VKLKRQNSELLRELFRLSALGMELALSICIGLAIGVFVDRKFHSSPWGLLAFLSLG